MLPGAQVPCLGAGARNKASLRLLLKLQPPFLGLYTEQSLPQGVNGCQDSMQGGMTAAGPSTQALFYAHCMDELIIGHKSYWLTSEETETQRRWAIYLKSRSSSVSVRGIGKKLLWQIPQ